MRLLASVVAVLVAASCASLPVPGNPKPCATCSSSPGVEDHSRHPKLGEVDEATCYVGDPDCVTKAGTSSALGLAGVTDWIPAVRTSPQTNPSIATIENLSPIAASDGFCVGATTSAVDAWASAPARITAQNGNIRWIMVCHADDTNASVDVCSSLNTSSGMTCAVDTGTRGWLTAVGSCISYDVARDSVGAAPAVFLRSASGTVKTCIDVGY